MVGTVKGGAGLQSLLQIISPLPQGKAKPLAKFAWTDAKAAERHSRDQEALEALKRANQDMKRQRKAAAAAKVERLKRELEQLRQFAGVGDPKAVARQVARIARELSAAVKEYRAGGGQPGPAEAAPAGGGADAVAAEGKGAEAQTAEAGGHARTAEQASANGHDKTPEQKEAEGKALTPQERAKKERDEFAKGIEQTFGEVQRHYDERNADQKFANDVRQVAAALKSLLATLKAKAERQDKDGDPEIERQLQAAAADLDEVDEALGGLLQPLPSVDVTV